MLSGSQPAGALLCACLLALAALPAHSEPRCASLTPRAATPDDAYLNLAPSQLTATTSAAARRLFATLDGHWTGQGTAWECAGSEGSPRRQAQQVELGFEHDRRGGGDELLMTAALHMPARNVQRTETLRLFANEQRLRVDRDAPVGDTLVLAASAGELQFVQRERRVGVATGTTVIEIERRFAVQGATLTVDQYVYVRGQLAQSVSWHLRRR